MKTHEYRVGVFHDEPRPGRKTKVRAYIIWFSEWEGCCIHKVTAESGTQAKAIAIGAHKAVCMREIP